MFQCRVFRNFEQRQQGLPDVQERVLNRPIFISGVFFVFFAQTDVNETLRLTFTDLDFGFILKQ